MRKWWLGAGIPWLVCRFKQYVMLRERLLTDTQGLRSRLGYAQLHPSSPSNIGGASRQHHPSQELSSVYDVHW